MTAWDPTQYEVFADHRMRPARDLVDRIPARSPGIVWDLGCGTGRPTLLLAKRWPRAAITGLDSSPEMLGRARRHEQIAWVQGDIESWEPPQAPDLIFSNAALHWIDDHPPLFTRLISFLGPGGTLAIQMPRNHTEPSHRRLFETARSERWSSLVGHLVRESPVLTADEYHRLLRPLTSHLDVWETAYQQALQGDDAVAEWTKGSVVRPYLDALGPAADEFYDDYAARLRGDYPTDADGTTLFRFRRLFIVAGV